MEYLRTVAIYLCQATGKIEPKYLNEVLKTTFPKQAGEVMPTIAERWVQQGKQEGLQQGLQQGRIEGRIEGLQQGSASFALLMLQRRIGKIDEKLQAQIRSLSFEQLEELGEALLDFEKPADLRAWLRAHRKEN